MTPGKYIRVEGDVNDGDYIEEWTPVDHLTDQEVKELKNKIESYNPEVDDYDEEINEFLPWMDNEELHTITEVEIITISKVE